MGSARVREPGTFVGGLWYFFWKTMLWAIAKVAFRLRIEGREHEPRRGPFIAVGNHVSAIDPPLVGIALRHRAAYMGKRELFDVPVLGPLLRSIGVFPVHRGAPDRSAIRKSLDVLGSGGVLVLFPEGTRSPDGRLQKPEPGTAMIALRTGAPVVPVAVINSQRILPKGARRPAFQQVVVRMGPPVSVPLVEGRLGHELLAEWSERILAAIERLLPEEQRRAP